MGKIISVSGAPEAGKTSVAMKLAQDIYCSTTDAAVIFLSPDILTPTMGLLFPSYNPEEVFSLGKALDNTEITQEDVLNNLVTVKTMKNFGCLGFKNGDNRLRFALPTQDKINSLLKVLTQLSGYLVVDCTNDEADLISKCAIACADNVVCVVKPDLKCMTYLSSNATTTQAYTEKTVNVMNCTRSDLYYPVEDVSSLINGVAVTLPYCAEVGQQLLDGTMIQRLKDKKYQRELHKLTNILM